MHGLQSLVNAFALAIHFFQFGLILVLRSVLINSTLLKVLDEIRPEDCKGCVADKCALEF
jgi:hypothetical protein